MVKIPRTLIALPLATILAGCGALTAENNVAELQQAPRVGSPFTAALAEEYREFSLFESEQMYDWPDADHFARKGLAAASGTVVEPERVENWNLPAGKVDELSNARTRLVTVLDAGARDRAPELAARAQGSYDCWVEQQEENHQPDHIAACREKFEQAMAELEKPQPAAAPPQTDYIVFFDFDSSVLTQEARAILREALKTIRERDPVRISITGHADRSGANAYNQALSMAPRPGRA